MNSDQNTLVETDQPLQLSCQEWNSGFEVSWWPNRVLNSPTWLVTCTRSTKSTQSKKTF